MIRDKYNQMNGPNSFLLFPKSNELTNPNNTGKRSEFLGGNIYWSTATGAHPVAHDFLTKWGQKGYEGGYLKYPTTDEIPISGGLNGRRQEYQGGSIYFEQTAGAHTIQGAIKDKWVALGAQTGILGFPTSDELVTPDGIGRYNLFQKGAIYWKPATGAHDITQPMFTAWLQFGAEGGKYGYPVTDTQTNGGVPTQGFERSVVDLQDFVGLHEAGTTECLDYHDGTVELYPEGAGGSFNCVGDFNVARTPEDAVVWGHKLSQKMQLKGQIGSATPMDCTMLLEKNGTGTFSGWNNHKANIPLDYPWHGSIPNQWLETGQEYGLGAFCDFKNNTGGATIIQNSMDFKLVNFD